MRVDEFDYDLPEELIAQTPLDDRAASRLLVLDKKNGVVKHKQFRDALSFFEKGDLIVMNDTRVTALRIFGKRATGAMVEALLLSEENGQYTALMRPGKKLKLGEVVEFEGGLSVRIKADLGAGKKQIEFLQANAKEKLQKAGRVPLPPYVHTALQDPERYQTVYAETGGSAAAPTAGLHFTQELLKKLGENGVKIAKVTLDVSIDTFRPVTSDTIEEHQMHGEMCTMPPETAKAINECKGRIIAVGTTTVRTLESFATGKKKVTSGSKSTKIFISPGYEFQIIDAMFTNFHMPRTTMLMMIAALAGKENITNAYQEAVSREYRFLSFGDSMLIQ